MKLVYSYLQKQGLNKLISSKKYSFEFSILNLSKSSNFTFLTKKREYGLILLNGKCKIKVNDLSYEQLERSNVFEDKPIGIYAPIKSSVTILAEADSEIAICSTISTNNKEPKIVKPKDLITKDIGTKNYARKVITIFNKENTNNLIIGETFHADPGIWSSIYPDSKDPSYFINSEEMVQPESYFVRLTPSDSFAIQYLNSSKQKIDKAIVLKHNDVSFMPFGRHPIVSPPGYCLYYLWFYIE